ncbi:glutamate-5-semialdehyde dehydrogenase [Saccharothrix coeruleofusca]|uniref:glutamate-5-semialdehyde dehydrogenase n=1 Tax=Saccharothrix coeruleofusca TaxID=33919 RepID=UPI001AE52A8F|nr:glutamate-5-semialdehyde dehydrogenase [Saccharothrix coeruleofusca]MBP2336693.1 glutamate-5-semialdehyde dehydrogenase [Saccharothrix coeruleofusca]
MIEQMLDSAHRALADAPAPGDAAYLALPRLLHERLCRDWDEVLRANESDLTVARQRGHPEALLGRMRLDPEDLSWLGELARQVAAHLPSALAPGPELRGASGVVTRRLPKPLGVLLAVYEARPTVTVEAALLAISAGNAVLLRGGKELARTNGVMAGTVASALSDAGLPPGLAHVLDDPDRSLLRELLKRHDRIDALIPRGSPTLIDYCAEHSRIPVIASGGGVNHLYVHRAADVELAAELVLDSKLPQPAGCTAVETVLVDGEVAGELVAALLRRAAEPGTPRFALRLPPDQVRRFAPVASGVDIDVADDGDNGREFLDRTLALRPVDGLDQAVRHIRRYGTGHTEGVITADTAVAERFCARVDAACLVVNGSLRLDDGPTMGLGPELSISTGRLHVRGPVTLDALLTHSWVVHGNGATREDHRAGKPAAVDAEQRGPVKISRQVGRSTREAVSAVVRRLVLRESRSPLSAEDIGEDEPLNGGTLRINSFGFVGMLVHLEDELDVRLPDDLFVGRRFETVGDLVDLVGSACASGATGTEEATG